MGKNLAAAVFPIALLSACGTPLTWQGPPGTAAEDLAATRSECMHRAEAWRSYNDQVYREATIQTEVNGVRSSPADFYSTANQLFDQCMIAQGYQLLPKGQ